MNIPMVDLHAQHRELREEIGAALDEVMTSGAFIRGPNAQAFEAEAAAFLGVRFAVGVASGTDALLLALRAAGIGPGDEVITTPFTFFATAEAISLIGARPVFADIDPQTFNLSPEAVRAAITPRTRALLPVHLYGLPADMDALMRIAAEHELEVIEDCAQSFGARIGERCTGSFGTAAAFSFYPSKNLGGCGDGGLVATDDEQLAARIRRLGNHGQEQTYRHEEVGYNSRLDEMQAAILRVKLRHLERFNEARRRAARLYSQALAELPLECPRERPGSSHVFHQYTVLADRREALRDALGAAGVASAVHYPVPLHRQPVYEHEHGQYSLPASESAAERCLSLPMHPHLHAAHIESVAEVLRRALSVS